jgi:hypothetical protein
MPLSGRDGGSVLLRVFFVWLVCLVVLWGPAFIVLYSDDENPNHETH